MTFCYHPHGFEFVPHENGTLLDYIIENTDPRFVSFEMDIFWIHTGGGDPAHLIRKYGDRWKLMHLKDYKKGKSVALGTGDLDIKNILKEAQKIGIEYYFIEDDNGKHVLTQLPQSIKYLNGLRYLEDEWMDLLDEDLSKWEPWIGIPLMSVEGIDSSKKSKRHNVGTPLGLNNDVKKVFSTVYNEDEIILKVSGEIFGALTSKEIYSNYHLLLQYKWGKKKWRPRLKSPKDSGLLYHCTGEQGFLWHTFMTSLEYQIAQWGTGNFHAVAGSNATIYSIDTLDNGGEAYTFMPGGKQYNVGKAKYGRGMVVASEDAKTNLGEWNTVELYCINGTSIHVLNGVVVNLVTNAHLFEDTLKVPLLSGKLQLQSSGAEIFYKNIRLRELKKFPKKIISSAGL